MSDLLRLYLDPAEVGPDGYPYAWHGKPTPFRSDGKVVYDGAASIKNLIREQAGHRCQRCGHPYRAGEHGNGEWTLCDKFCTHSGPFMVGRVEQDDTEKLWLGEEAETLVDGLRHGILEPDGFNVGAQWRILTVHHLNGVKHDCRWWNLVALCQRCHLKVQGRVNMAQVYPHPHSVWFMPYAAAHYAWVYRNEELTREETMERLDELLALELDPTYVTP